MTNQALGFMELCRGNYEATIRKALNTLHPTIKKEIVDHYGGIENAIVNLKLGNITSKQSFR